MSYFDKTSYELVSGSLARTDQINNILSGLETSFNKLPSESTVNRGTWNYVVDSGAADAYVVSLEQTPTSYTDGMLVVMKASAANATTTPTVNVDSLGNKTITRNDGSAVAAGDIPADKIVVMRYNSTSGKFEISSSLPVIASEAESSKDDAEIAQAAAEAAQTNAETAETNAETAESNAEDWASKAEGSIVSGTKYSALHYAAKAEASATSVNADNIASRTFFFATM